MKQTASLLLLTAGLLLAALPAAAGRKTPLEQDHIDLGVAFEDGSWDLHLHDESNDREFEPDAALLRVGAAARTTVPADPGYAFLGAAGSPVWILPAVQNSDLLFLGLGAEEVAPGILLGDTVRLHLRRVRGPGEFAVYAIDAFGSPVVGMNTRDGLGAGDAVDLVAGAHSDFNWAFSRPGRYQVTFEATGQLVDGTPVSSGESTFFFHVEAARPPAR